MAGLAIENSIPRQVREQLEQATAAFKAQRDGTPTPQQLEPDMSGIPGLIPADQAPAPAPLPMDTPPAPPAPPQYNDEIASLRQEMTRVTDSLRTLQGKYNAEIPRMAQVISERDQEIARLRSEANSVMEPAREMDEAQLKQHYGLTDDDLLDPTLVHLIRRISVADAKRAAAAARLAVQEEITPVRQQFQESAQRAWESRLQAAIPDIEAVDKNPGFIAWVRQKAPYSTRTYQDLLDDAYEAQDLSSLMEIVNAWRGHTSPNGPQRPSVESQRTPESRPNTRPADTRVTYDQYQFAELCTRLTKLPPGSPAYLKLQNEIDAARAEGRILARRR